MNAVGAALNIKHVIRIPFLFLTIFSSFLPGENPAAMQTGTSSQRLQSPLPLLSVLVLLAVVQKLMADAATAAESGAAAAASSAALA